MKTVSQIRRESLVFILVLIAIFVVLNILAIKVFGRWDLTESKVHSLSSGSIHLIKGLKDRLTVKAYFTEDLPPPFNAHARYVRDILEEYQANAGGKMVLEFIDPTNKEDLEKEAQQFGIQKVGHRVINKDQSEVKLGYRGIAFTYGAKTLSIPAVQDTMGLEYEITTVLKQLVGEKKTIGVLVGHGEPKIEVPPEQYQMMMQQHQEPPKGAMSILREALPQYNFKEIDLQKGEKDLPPDISALLVAGTLEPIPEIERFKIDQYLMKGGSVAFFVDGVHVEIKDPPMQGMPPSFEAKMNETGLRDQLLAYGVKLGSDLVLDMRANLFPTMCPPVPMPIPMRYPGWPVATDLPVSNPVTFRLPMVTLPWTSSVELTDKALLPGTGVQAEVIARSSDHSWRLTSDFVVDPCKLGEPQMFQSGVGLAATLNGNFVSAWAGKEPPKAIDEAKAEGQPPKKIDKAEKPGRLIVVGTSWAPTDGIMSYLTRIERSDRVSNLAFMANAMDWMTQDEDLIAVRAKGIEEPPLDSVEESKRLSMKYGLIVGIPMIFILFGILRWRFRVARHARLKSE